MLDADGLKLKQLILSCRSHDHTRELAFASLHDTYFATAIKQVVNRYHQLRLSDDHSQDILVAIHLHIQNDKITDDYIENFAKYVYVWCRNALCDRLAKGYQKKAIPQSKLWSLDMAMTEDGDGGMAALIPDKPVPTGTHDIEAICKTIKMSKLERYCFEAVIVRGRTYEQAAKAYGCSLKAVDNALMRVRPKCSKKLLKMGYEPPASRTKLDDRRRN